MNELVWWSRLAVRTVDSLFTTSKTTHYRQDGIKILMVTTPVIDSDTPKFPNNMGILAVTFSSCCNVVVHQ